MRVLVWNRRSAIYSGKMELYCFMKLGGGSVEDIEEQAENVAYAKKLAPGTILGGLREVSVVFASDSEEFFRAST